MHNVTHPETIMMYFDHQPNQVVSIRVNVKPEVLARLLEVFRSGGLTVIPISVAETANNDTIRVNDKNIRILGKLVTGGRQPGSPEEGGIIYFGGTRAILIEADMQFIHRIREECHGTFEFYGENAALNKASYLAKQLCLPFEIIEMVQDV